MEKNPDLWSAIVIVALARWEWKEKWVSLRRKNGIKHEERLKFSWTGRKICNGREYTGGGRVIGGRF
jgi:hypothetical protein